MRPELYGGVLVFGSCRRQRHAIGCRRDRSPRGQARELNRLAVMSAGTSVPVLVYGDVGPLALGGGRLAWIQGGQF